MPSSLVFAALAAAWIVVLVPMVARHRQEVRRTADSALAARVLRRGVVFEHDPSYDSASDPDYADEDDRGHGSAGDREPERRVDDRHDRRRADARRLEARHDPRHHDPRQDLRHEAWPEEASDMADDELPARDARYRPGRGGFDPAAAELAARAKYALRQRVVLFLLLTAVVTAVFALVMMPVLWWAHGAADVTLVGYLAYLRRQVRIEQEIRRRRTERLRARRVGPPRDEHDDEDSPADRLDDVVDEAPARRDERPVHPGALVIDLDDEDPGLWELDSDVAAPYRRAAGE